MTTYRTSEFSYSCSLCSDHAHFTCPRCGRPLCSLHAVVGNDRCAYCEGEFTTRKSTWIMSLGIASLVTLLISIIAYASYMNIKYVVLAAAISFVFSFAGSEGVNRRLQRYAFLHEGKQDITLTAINIAPASELEIHYRRVGLPTVNHDRVNRGVPQVPIYQRTYGVG